MRVSTREHASRDAAIGGDVDFYRVFAYCFGPPEPERFRWLSNRDLARAFAQMWSGLGAEGEFSWRPFRSHAEYETAYIALFDVGVPEPPVPLVESAHVRHTPAQQIALENTEFYGVLGLRHEPASFPPDHLMTQLEFLSAVRYAAEKNASPENSASLARLQRDFLERHLLNWLPVALEKLNRARAPVFALLLGLLLAFLRYESRKVGEQLESWASP